ncbi:MAG: hypothetical protein O3A84_16460, partial [Proteobacteria bacterium]|nr:hypothetical protein [Pseudomonadota bacterium]
MQKRLNLLTIITGLVLCLAAGLVVFAFRFHETSQLERDTADRAMVISQGISAAVADQYRRLAALGPGLKGDALRRRAEITEMRKAVGQVTDGLSVLHVRIVDGRGVVLLAMDPNEIGETITPSAAVDPSLNHIRRTSVAADTKGGARERYVFANSTALSQSGTAASGRIELRLDVTNNIEALDRESRSLAAGLSIVLFFLFLLLYSL